MTNTTTTNESIPASPPSAALAIPVSLEAGLTGDALRPVTFGIPLPQGRFQHSPAAATLVANSDTRTPAQIQPLNHWPDGSPQWLLVDALLSADFDGVTSAEVHLFDEAPESPPQSAPRHRKNRTDRSRHRTGPIHARTGRAQSAPASRARRSRPHRPRTAAPAHRPKRTPPRADLGPRNHRNQGPVRTTIALCGRFTALRGLRVSARLSFFATTGLVRCDLTLHNSRRARHKGGLWDLGDRGSHLFEDFSIHLPSALPGPSTIAHCLDAHSPDWASAESSFHVYQDSSGGENWQSRVHVNRDGVVPCRFRGYEATADGVQHTGLRASPSVALQAEHACISAAVPEFWQQFPKALSVEDGTIRIGLFPREFDDLHELQGGEQKTHSVWFDFSTNPQPDATLDDVFDPTVVLPEANWCTQAGVLGNLLPNPSPARDCLETILDEALAGDHGIPANQDRVDEFGWRNFGEIFADHEQAYYTGSESLVSHYNNQFDMVQGFLLQRLRTRDRRWYTLADALARHVIDIDIYHTRQDKPAYSGGLFWFTDHYLHAQTSSHRTYSRSNQPATGHPYGGGPGAEHNFSTGLRLYHLLTGNPRARSAVLELAHWVIRMDDGQATILGIIDDGPTGLATAGCDPDYSGPGRGGGNSINTLLDAWILTRDDAYLKFAENLIRRCVHPNDDVHAHNLLDVEKRWSYTVFLVALAKYLDLKQEANQLDEMFAYARDSLLRYAHWMCEHEQPYFDQEQNLEFPTEAWAAQELRKANVLRLAAQYADEKSRPRFTTRGNELGDRAWNDLLRFEQTRMYARAVAIVMTDGLNDCVLRPSKPQPAPDRCFENSTRSTEPFIPQRQRVREMFRSPAGLLRIGIRAANPARWLRWV